MDPFLAHLLGQAGTAPPPQTEENVIEVNDTPYPKKKAKFFDKKGTGGRILGTIGDALLIGSGNKPIYSERVRQADLKDAMIDWTDNPQRAIERVSQVDPALSAELSEQLSAEQLRAAQQRAIEDEYRQTTDARAFAWLGSATEKTLPQVKELVKRHYVERGGEAPFDIDSINSVEDALAWAQGGLTPKDRGSLEETRRYHDETLRQDRREEFGRNYREVYGEVSSNQRADKAEAGRETRSVRDNQTRRETSGKTARPDIKFGIRPDGTRYVIR